MRWCLRSVSSAESISTAVKNTPRLVLRSSARMKFSNQVLPRGQPARHSASNTSSMSSASSAMRGVLAAGWATGL
jgi:hypothetical protein